MTPSFSRSTAQCRMFLPSLPGLLHSGQEQNMTWSKGLCSFILSSLWLPIFCLSKTKTETVQMLVKRLFNYLIISKCMIVCACMRSNSWKFTVSTSVSNNVVKRYIKIELTLILPKWQGYSAAAYTTYTINKMWRQETIPWSLWTPWSQMPQMKEIIQIGGISLWSDKHVGNNIGLPACSLTFTFISVRVIEDLYI